MLSAMELKFLRYLTLAYSETIAKTWYGLIPVQFCTVA